MRVSSHEISRNDPWMSRGVRVLVVGAGAVGQAYGRHLHLGGAEVTYFVRDRYRAAVERGFDMYVLRAWRRPRPVEFRELQVVTTPREVAERTFDQVYVTVSSAALAGPWLAELVAACHDATIVALQPGQDDHDAFVAAGAPEDRLVSGVITLISYAAPLAHETRFPAPGTAYWLPPLAPCQLSGPRARTDAVVAALRAGKLPAVRVADVRRTVAFPSAVLMPYLAALEAAGWSMRDFAASAAIQLGTTAAREALAIVASREGRQPPFTARFLARPRALRFVLWLARRFAPFPFEDYVREHFTKVRAQTVGFLAAYIDRGNAAGLPVAALEELHASMRSSATAAA